MAAPSSLRRRQAASSRSRQQGTTVFKNIIAADPPLSGSFASVTSPITLFSATRSLTTASALDAFLARRAFGERAVLTRLAFHGLDAPRVLTSAIQDRLVANGGALRCRQRQCGG